MHGLLEGERRRIRHGAKAKTALLGVLRDEASACQELDLALRGVVGSAADGAAPSIGDANRELRAAAAEARAAVGIVTGS